MNSQQNNKKETTKRMAFLAICKDNIILFWKVLRNNLIWKILSLFVAIMLWAGLIMQDPTLTREITFNDAKVTVTGVEQMRRDGFIISSGLSNEDLMVNMTADVPQRVYSYVTETRFNPRIDLSGIKSTGEQSLQILTSTTATYGKVDGIEPSTIDVVVENYVTNFRVPVTVNVQGDYPVGYYGMTPTLDPSIVAVSGPESLVEKVAGIVVDLHIDRLPMSTGNIKQALPMRIVDDAGETIESNLLEVLNAGMIQRSIIVNQKLYASKSLTVDNEALISGRVKKGYEVKGVKTSPSTVVVAGDKTALEQLNVIYLKNSVDVQNSDQNMAVQVDLAKPSEIVYLSNQTVNVLVEIEPIIETKTFNNINIDVRNTPENVKTQLSDKKVNVSITGPQLILRELNSRAIIAYVEMTDETTSGASVPIRLIIDNEDSNLLSYQLSTDTLEITIVE